MLKLSTIFLLSLLVFSCKKDNVISNNNVQIAFMADVHLQDIYGQFSDNDYKGILNSETGKYTLARTMQSQLQSTRLYNENYFAFLAALDDVVRRGVKMVVLPGDFSDDGQAFNIRGLKHILNDYSEKHGIRFILTTGNHDPVRPFRMQAGKTDFLGKNGQSQPIFSEKELFLDEKGDYLPVIQTKDIAKLGYVGILNELKDFGFFPKPDDWYWETPFSDYSYSTYSFKDAERQSVVKNRTYKTSENKPQIPDVSYLVEPMKDVWFLAIDANVYVTKNDAEKNPENLKFYNSASIGFNNLILHKTHLLNWIKSVANRANELNKTLIVFSHYPTLDFYDGAVPEIKALFGDNKMQLHRVPNEQVSQLLIEAGVNVHFGGHMHMNDTAINLLESGSLVNVQIPSLAAYIPAYKLLTVKEKGVFDIETVVIDEVPNFNNLFPLYEKEYEHLVTIKDTLVWNMEILKAKTYKEFTEWHLNELVRLRFLKEDWPKELKELLIESTGEELLRVSAKSEAEFTRLLDECEKQIQIDSFNTWTGLDMINDFYKIRNADELAYTDIKSSRLQSYIKLCELLSKSDHEELKLWGSLFIKMCNGAPAENFRIYVEIGKIERIEP